MTRDYSKGFIYKLCCKDVNVKEIYVGSSINMKNRKNQHKTDCNNINSDKYNQKKYKYIRENGNWSNWSMIWIKDFPCNNKRELQAEEDKIMKELNATLNMVDAIKDKEKHKKKMKEYYEKNKKKIILRVSERYEEKKEDIKIYKKEWCEKNKEKRQIQNKKRYEENKEEIRKLRNINIKCECGCEISKSNLTRHRKSKKHQSFISSNI